MKKKCPYCEDSLQVVDVDIECYDVLGCIGCAWDENDSDKNNEMSWYL